MPSGPNNGALLESLGQGMNGGQFEVGVIRQRLSIVQWWEGFARSAVTRTLIRRDPKIGAHD